MLLALSTSSQRCSQDVWDYSSKVQTGFVWIYEYWEKIGLRLLLWLFGLCGTHQDTIQDKDSGIWGVEVTASTAQR